MMLTACSASQFADLPVVGLPAGTPERPAEQLPYPAVHDMPEPRTTKPLNDNELRQAATELEEARDQQASRARPAARTKTPTRPRSGAESAGAVRNP